MVGEGSISILRVGELLQLGSAGSPFDSKYGSVQWRKGFLSQSTVYGFTNEYSSLIETRDVVGI